MRLFTVNILFLLLASSICLKPQVKNHERGDGFWSLVNPIRLNNIIWLNDTLYASRNPLYQSNGGVYRSVDGGESWDTLYSVSDVLSSGLRLFIHPTNHKILYMIYGSLYRSTNAGQTWQTIFSSFGPLVRLGINRKNPDIMYVTKSIPYGAVFKTTDGGLDWNDASNGLPSEEYFQAGPIEINPEFPDTILLGTNAGLYRSTNGGMNWDTTKVKGFIPGLNIHPKLPNIAFAGTTYDWATYKTTDFGGTWYKTIGSRGAIKYLFNFLYDSLIYCSENSRSTNYGESWVKLDSLYNSWNDLAIDNLKNPTIYGLNITYGLFEYTDMISSIDTYLRGETLPESSSNPNPFNNSTTINCILKQTSSLNIYIYNSLGQKIKTLVNQTELTAGQYNYLWNGQDDSNANVASGFYLCVLITENNDKKEIQTLKLLLLK